MKAFTLPLVVAAIGAAVLCPICDSAIATAQPAARTAALGLTAPAFATQQVGDTATVRLHISGMTCGSCPVTARTALRKVSGVYSAAVTLDDSLGVVRFDPRKVKATEIASQLTKMTGYAAKILPDSAVTPKKKS